MTDPEETELPADLRAFLAGDPGAIAFAHEVVANYLALSAQADQRERGNLRARAVNIARHRFLDGSDIPAASRTVLLHTVAAFDRPHPVVVLTINVLIPRLSAVTVAVVTGTEGPAQAHIPADSKPGLAGYDVSYVNATDLHSVDTSRLRHRRSSTATTARFSLPALQ